MAAEPKHDEKTYYLVFWARLLVAACFCFLLLPTLGLAQTLGVAYDELTRGLEKVFPTIVPYEDQHYKGGRIVGLKGDSPWPLFKIIIIGPKYGITGVTIMCPLCENCYNEHRAQIVPLFLKLLDNVTPDWQGETREKWIRDYIKLALAKGERYSLKGCIGTSYDEAGVHYVGKNKVEIVTSNPGVISISIYSPWFYLN